jgi:hypothetical protein
MKILYKTIVALGILAIAFAVDLTIARAEHNPLVVGETLIYKIYYGAIPAGNQRMKIVERLNYNGNDAYRIRMEMGTSSTASILYKYHEEEDLILDAKGFFPLYTLRKVQDRKKTFVQETFFSHADQQIIQKTKRNGELHSAVFSMKEPCQEGLSLYYYLRTRPWERGSNSFPFLKKDGPKVYSFQVQDGGEYKTALGAFNVDQVDNGELEYTLLFTRDTNAYPLQIDIKGRFDSRLIQVEYE